MISSLSMAISSSWHIAGWYSLQKTCQTRHFRCGIFWGVHTFFFFIYCLQCVRTSSALRHCNFHMAIHHNCILYVVTRCHCKSIFLQGTAAYYFLLPVVFGVVIFIFTCLLVSCGVCLTPVSPDCHYFRQFCWFLYLIEGTLNIDSTSMVRRRRMTHARILVTWHLPKQNEYLSGVMRRNTLHIRWRVRNIK